MKTVKVSHKDLLTLAEHTNNMELANALSSLESTIVLLVDQHEEIYGEGGWISSTD